MFPDMATETEKLNNSPAVTQLTSHTRQSRPAPKRVTLTTPVLPKRGPSQSTFPFYPHTLAASTIVYILKK